MTTPATTLNDIFRTYDDTQAPEHSEPVEPQELQAPEHSEPQELPVLDAIPPPDIPALVIDDLRGATPKIPYPARRRYEWAVASNTITHPEALALFDKMRKSQQRRDKNPQRWDALLLASASVEHLYHTKHITAFPGDRLHKLLIKAALKTDWCPDLNAVQRARRATPVEGDSNLLRCPGCGLDRPFTSFLVPVSAKQADRWGLAPDTKQRTKGRICDSCRDVKAARLRLADRRRAARSVEVHYLKAVLNEDFEQAISLFEDYWSQHIRQHIDAAEGALKRCQHLPTRDFYTLKLHALMAALEVAHTCATSDAVYKYLTPHNDWTAFLSDDDRQRLIQTHIETIIQRRQDRIIARHPRI